MAGAHSERSRSVMGAWTLESSKFKSLCPSIQPLRPPAHLGPVPEIWTSHISGLLLKKATAGTPPNPTWLGKEEWVLAPPGLH